MKLFQLFMFLVAISAKICTDNIKTLRFYVASDTNNWASGPDMLDGGKAKIMPTISSWTAKAPTSIWIWDATAVSQPDAIQTVIFLNEFFIPGTVKSAILDVAADNDIQIWVNGASIGCDKKGASFQSNNQQKCDILRFVKAGMNAIQFSVTNTGGPAGLLYTITIDTLVVY